MILNNINSTLITANGTIRYSSEENKTLNPTTKLICPHERNSVG